MYFLYFNNIQKKLSKPLKVPFVNCYETKKTMQDRNYFVFEDIETFLKNFVSGAQFLPIDYYFEKIGESGVDIGLNEQKESVLNNFMTQIVHARYSFDIRICAELGSFILFIYLLI